MRKISLISALLLVMVLSITVTCDVSKAANVCPVINKVSTYVNSNYVCADDACPSPILVKVGDTVTIKVICTAGSTESMVTLKWWDKSVVTAKIPGNPTKPQKSTLVTFSKTVSSTIPKTKCTELSITSSKLGCGQRWGFSPCFKTK